LVSEDEYSIGNARIADRGWFDGSVLLYHACLRLLFYTLGRLSESLKDSGICGDHKASDLGAWGASLAGKGALHIVI
jgi:hypothetical protein